MDKIATAILYVRNSLGALVAPIINAVAPALDYLADKFVEVLNVFNEFIAALTGASTYTVAKKIGTQFKEIESGASGASKALKTFTIGIDELNIIQDTGGSGGGAGGLNNVAEDWFEKQEVSNDMKNFADQVKSMAEDVRGYLDYMWSGDVWYDFGEKIVTGWESAKAGAKGYFDYVRSGQATVDVASVIGEKGADVIEWTLGKAYDYLVWLLKTAKNLPKYIDEVITEVDKLKGKFDFKEHLLWDLLPDTIKDVITPLQDVYNLFSSIWKIVRKIKKFVTDIVNALKIITTGKVDLSGLANAVRGNFSQENIGRSAVEVGRQIFNNILNGFTTNAEHSRSSIITNVFKLITGVGSEANSLASQQGLFAGRSFAENIGLGVTQKSSALYSKVGSLASTSASRFKGAVNWDSEGQNIVNGVTTGIEKKSGTLYTAIEKLASNTEKKFKKKLGISSPSKVFEEDAFWTIEGFNKGITKYGGSTLGLVDNWASSIERMATTDFSNISMPSVSDIVGEVQGYIATTGAMTVKSDSDEMVSLLADVLPLLVNIADDTKRQADKEEVTEVVLDNRKVTDSVNRQNKINGFSFT